jgi:DUF438 domain-containing protein
MIPGEHLPLGHPIRVMMAEHQVILTMLQRLEQTNEVIRQMNVLRPESSELRTIGEIAADLLSAEPHHQREEQALFPALEELGIEGPPQMMQMEHEELRERKHELELLATTTEDISDNERKRRIQDASRFLVVALRAHIQKENEILYPMALDSLDPSAWSAIARACDEIGYCPFTPR